MMMPLRVMRLRVREFLAKKPIMKMGQPPYSPNLAPAIFGFPKLKNTPKQRRFSDIPDIQQNGTTLL
jgi:transposase